MRLRSLYAANYRSLRAIRMDLGGITLFVGENGVGKSNLYRALQLVQAAAGGMLAREIAAEGGMASVLWTGPRRDDGKPVRIRLEVELLDEEQAVAYRYRVEAGLRPPLGAGFAFEPQIKAETFSIVSGARPVVMMKRAGPAIEARDERGRMALYPGQAMLSETAMALLGDAGRFPEIGAFRRLVGGWRFYHGFRSDPASPLRRPCLAVTAPLLDADGGNLAAVFATLVHIREDTVELDRAIAAALGGARLHVPDPDEQARFGLVLPEFPRRIFDPRELSDGQIRFLGLAGALLSYRQPPLIALNEPEASLHPDMLEPLADMIATAGRSSQIWIVTHSERLAAAVARRTGLRPRRVIREDGATSIEGLRLTGALDGEEE
ncbi:AAA family ATPase [Ensifer soli]|uniref:AAA family ATPase n=1 Tax=Ciceribacter sp. sgz301302 TaxID=3342379 RepID=UPI0035BA3880